MKKGESLPCNGRQKNDCPMDGKCRTMKTVYKCIASVPTKPDKNYIRLSQDEWKKHYYNHRKSFQNQLYQSETMLSSYCGKKKVLSTKYPPWNGQSLQFYQVTQISRNVINFVYMKNMQSLHTQIRKTY